MVAYSRITAPFAGVVTKRYADTGSLVGAGTGSGSQALIRLSQVDPLRLVLPVPESAVSKVHPGTAVEILIQSTRQSLSAVVARTSGRVSTETRTMHVELDIPNPSLALAPGMYATAMLNLETRSQTLAIPLEALQEREDAAATVLVLGKQHRIEQRKITTGLETPTRVEVLSGLAVGDMVVLGARGRYQPGDSAEPRLAAESGAR
jgi:RND family efflux transporter MFP subunit